MFLTSGTDGSTAEGIHTAIDEVEVFPKNQISWENCKSECRQHIHYDRKEQFHCFKILGEKLKCFHCRLPLPSNCCK